MNCQEEKCNVFLNLIRFPGPSRGGGGGGGGGRGAPSGSVTAKAGGAAGKYTANKTATQRPGPSASVKARSGSTSGSGNGNASEVTSSGGGPNNTRRGKPVVEVKGPRGAGAGRRSPDADKQRSYGNVDAKENLAVSDLFAVAKQAID